MSYVRHYYHIVFTPKNREPLIHPEIKRDIYRLIYHQIVKINGFVHRINGTEDHVHILASIPAKIAVSEAVKVIKAGGVEKYNQHETYSQLEQMARRVFKFHV